MLILYHIEAWRKVAVAQELGQSQEGSQRDRRNRGQSHGSTDGGVEHPLWDFDGPTGLRVQLTVEGRDSATCSLRHNDNRFSVPGVPGIAELADLADMSFLSRS